jgi:hypothetical protein
MLKQDQERADQVGREVVIHQLVKTDGPEIIALAQESRYDLVILPLPAESAADPLGQLDARGQYIVRHAHCRVMMATVPIIPQEIVDNTPSARP